VGFGSMTWRRVRREYFYEAQTGDEISFAVDTVELPNGARRRYSFVDCPYHVVAVVAVDELERIAMIKQHRYLVDEILLEVPCGSPDVGESLAEGAKRELLEEIGYTADVLTELGTYYPCVGISNQRVTAFLATGLTARRQMLGEMEDISVEWVPRNEVLGMLKRGALTNQVAAHALALAVLRQA
jgi:ADP-ribose pyrophosphatase